MAFLFYECEPFRKGLSPQSSVDTIAWAYLRALSQAQEAIGIYYMFDLGQVDVPKTIKIVNRLSLLNLARKDGQEAGTKNTYMKITDLGTDVADRFSSLADYENYLAEEKEKQRPNSGIIIGGSVSGSQIGQGSSFGNLSPMSMPTSNDSRQHKAEKTKWKEIIITGIIGLLVTLIALYIEHNTNWFKP